jgi:hypothetical protein
VDHHGTEQLESQPAPLEQPQSRHAPEHEAAEEPEAPPRRDRAAAARLRQGTASSRQKERAQHHFHRRRTVLAGGEDEDGEESRRPAAAPIDLVQFLESPSAEALATLERFNAEVEEQLVEAGSAAAQPETWTSWASTFHPELAEVQRPISTRGATTASGCVSAFR